MDFIINETGERKQVSCLAKNGTDVADDVAFTCGLLENNDVVWDEEENAYIAPEEVVEYWVEFFEIYGSCEEELDHLKDLYGDEAFKIYCEEMGGDFDIDYFQDAVEATKSILQKRYDTTTACIIANYESEFLYTDFRYFNESLYRQDDGNYFIAGEGGPMTRYGWNDGDGCSYYGEGIYSVTVAEAQKWFKERFGKESNDIR